MVRYTPEIKHHILTHYAANVLGSGYRALATRFAIKGGASVVRRWHERWDGTPGSLATRPRTGRPRLLTHRQVTQHILDPIRRANRAHKAVHYPAIRRQAERATRTALSLRTVQRYGKEKKVKDKRTSKHTSQERTCVHALCCGRLILI